MALGKPRFLLLMIITVLAAGVLVACGGNQGASTDVNRQAGNPAANQGKKITIKFSHVTTPESVKGQAAEKFKELAEQYTDGRVEVQVFPSGQLYGDTEEMEALMSGNVQMIAPSITKLMSLNPSFQIIDLPFLWKDNQHLYEFWDGELGQQLFDTLKPHHIQGLAMWPNGFKHFTSKNHDLLTPDKFKGVKFRIPSGAMQERQYELLGASAVTIPFNESYIALQQGTVDATENTLDNIYRMKYGEVQDYLTLVGFARVDYAVLANAEFWDSMPEDVRAGVEKALEEATGYARELAEKADREALESIKKENYMTIVEMTEEQKQEFRKVLQPLYDEYQDVIGKDLIEAAEKLAE